MKATGIIRRVDELGRIVIPKEVRRSLGVHEGEPLEFYTEGHDIICLRKYKTNLMDEIDHLEKIISYCVDDDQKMAKIRNLLIQIQELVKGEV